MFPMYSLFSILASHIHGIGHNFNIGLDLCLLSFFWNYLISGQPFLGFSILDHFKGFYVSGPMIYIAKFKEEKWLKFYKIIVVRIVSKMSPLGDVKHSVWKSYLVMRWMLITTFKVASVRKVNIGDDLEPTIGNNIDIWERNLSKHMSK